MVKGSPIRMTGTVKMWMIERGYGFVIPDDGGPDILLHRSCLENAGIVRIKKGFFVELLYVWRNATQRYTHQVLSVRPNEEAEDLV